MTRNDLIALALATLRASDLSPRLARAAASDAVIDAAIDAGAESLIEDDGAVDEIVAEAADQLARD